MSSSFYNIMPPSSMPIPQPKQADSDKTMPVPGRRCAACLLEKGDTVWVIPGNRCPQCGTSVN
ncbi:hypothetical protein BDV96DRAFT_560707 [Lophiotrema nucula]|uniref:Uncharacterized protein n=1 Tax=Lophiotrema nucula TaxID=690887 RepID=A0A6A5YET2_9PLEO|nr:hypothetical protein BDV96DRAFT_560707 [Lophiotrema nucula]